MALRSPGSIVTKLAQARLSPSPPLLQIRPQPLRRPSSLLSPLSSLSSFSSLPPCRTRNSLHLLRPTLSNGASFVQRRWQSANISHNMLSHMEQTANKNPSSATAQNAFYSALLRAGMPGIIVQRYKSAQFASNAAVEATYGKALVALEKGGPGLGMQASQGQVAPAAQGSVSPQQMAAVAQALAADGSGASVSKMAGGTGEKASPLYVVVEESFMTKVFRWCKFLFWFGLTTWVALVIVTLVIETTGVLKKVGGTQNSEAQAQHQKTRFSDVHGCDEAKDELQELVEFLKDPARFSSLGGKLPKGVLLMGPPGTGKTLLARAVAGEAGVPFFFMSGSEFDEIYVGVGAKRVRELFAAARAKAPAIIFIDELDAVGGKRNDKDAAYIKQTLNQLLTEMDGFSQETGVIILGATNFPQSLDKALTRPGRFDRQVQVPLPDVRGRVQILKYHLRNVKTAPEFDVTVLARGTPGFSGADLENLINQAAVRASKNKEKRVGVLDFEWAKDKIMLGAERRSAVIQDKDRLMTAYHEGGHALVAMFTEGADPLYKVTIMPRGPALGITHLLPEMDQVSQSKRQLRASLDVTMGGKIAEEIIYGTDNVTSGASSDISNATRTAYAMVTKFGFSDELGDVDFDSAYRSLSSETKQRIESEVKRIIDEAKERARLLLQSKRKELDLLAKALVEYEVLNLDETQKVLKGEKLPKLSATPRTPMKLPEVPELNIPGIAGSTASATEASGVGGGKSSKEGEATV